VKRRLLALAAALIVGAAGLAVPIAQAADSDEITRFEVDATIDPTGRIAVTQTIDDYFASSGHGPYLWLVTRQAYDDTHDRLITYSNFRVSSPTGAPVDLQTTTGSNYLQLRIGNANRTVVGSQTYVITYTVSGILNPAVASSGLDELYWNIIGGSWELPISNVSVTIHGPADVAKTTCWTGPDFTSTCTASTFAGPTASYTQDQLSPHQGLAVVAGWPIGTFSQVQTQIVSSSQNPFDLTNGGGALAGGAGGLTVLAAGFVVWRRQRTRPSQLKDVPVEFAPPPDVPPWAAGAILRQGPEDLDITATIVALAVRGFIQFEQTTRKSFTLHTTTTGPGGLTGPELAVYQGLFADGDEVTSQTLGSAGFSKTFSGWREVFRRDFLARGWYRRDPKKTIASYQIVGTLLVLGGLGLGLGFGIALAARGIVGLAWLVVPVVVLGIGLVIIARRMPIRTAAGAALATQAAGFQKYLKTAEADQIRWEETQDIFSQYLPYAIAFGCADHWAKVFDDLAAQGKPVPTPLWYTGYEGWQTRGWHGVTRSINQVGSSFEQAVRAEAARTSGSSGGSGFSGGGGGGVGGGGGGNW